MASVTALNTLSIFQYNQLGDENSIINQGVDLGAECKSCLALVYADLSQEDQYRLLRVRL
jgi:hypothetical protein